MSLFLEPPQSLLRLIRKPEKGGDDRMSGCSVAEVLFDWSRWVSRLRWELNVSGDDSKVADATCSGLSSVGAAW